MSSKKTRVALLFGGRSAEHDVSILSARSIFEATPKQRFDVTPICVARDGKFIGPDSSAKVLATGEKSATGEKGFSFEQWSQKESIDVVFPIIHGTYGEDGSLQGYLEILGIPYVGSGVTGSAVGMDKWQMKYAFASAKLPMVEHVQIALSDWKSDSERISRTVANSLRLPYFVKPANAGSSVGVSKVKSDSELTDAINKAFRFDDKVLVERGIDAREIEVSVLGNDTPEASLPGEIVAGAEFYNYEDKYIDNKSSLVIPAKLSKARIEEIRRLAIEGYKAIGASGFARVDFFLERGTDRLYLNEINTLPGFTSISMYPKLWEATELRYSKLIERLIDLGIERAQTRSERFEDTMRFFDEVKSLTS
ncbi:MAG TPA: D-alanine--D-alanine ligase family protein [Thermoanaerobaculia bacterium]|nr:D-alanine--D-alanine ligase family protein [Thermoanaerobaculia bacterium]